MSFHGLGNRRRGCSRVSSKLPPEKLGRGDSGHRAFRRGMRWMVGRLKGREGWVGGQVPSQEEEVGENSWCFWAVIKNTLVSCDFCFFWGGDEIVSSCIGIIGHYKLLWGCPLTSQYQGMSQGFWTPAHFLCFVKIQNEKQIREDCYLLCFFLKKSFRPEQLACGWLQFGCWGYYRSLFIEIK